MDKAEESVLRMLERCGGKANRASLQVSVQAIDALERLIQRGQVRGVGLFSDAVEIVPDAVRKTDIEPDARPQTEPKPEPIRTKQRRPYYSPLTGLWPDRIRQMEARVIHFISNYGDQDEEGRWKCPRRALERGLNANRHAEEWKPAINSLLARKSIEIVGRDVILADSAYEERLPDPFDPVGLKEQKAERQRKRARRRKRPLSEWVKRRILERGGVLPVQ